MPDPISNPTILVPIDAKGPSDPHPALVELLSPHRVVVLGYYEVPDQTVTDQAREQFGESATETTEAVAERFAGRGAGAESVVVFTRDRSTTIDTTAAEYGVDAVFTPGDVGEPLDRILVPLRGDDNLARILGFAGVLLRESDAAATMFNVADSEDEASRGELLVRGACDRLKDIEGIDPERVDWRQTRDSSATNAIVEAGKDHDLLVVGESKPSLTDRILGAVTNEVIEASSDPLLIVRDK